MNEEEKEVYQTLTDEKNAVYEELNDDFVLMLNGGLRGVELIKEEEVEEEEEGENAGVIVASGDDNTPIDNPLIPNYKEKMASVIAALDRQNELRKESELKGRKGAEVEKEISKIVN